MSSLISADIDKEGGVNKHDGMEDRCTLPSLCPATSIFGFKTDASLPYIQERQYNPSQSESIIADFVKSSPQVAIPAEPTTGNSLSSSSESLLPFPLRCCGKSDHRIEEGSATAASPSVSYKVLKNIPITARKKNKGEGVSNTTIPTQATPLTPPTASTMTTAPQMADHSFVSIATMTDINADSTKTASASTPQTPLFSPRVLEVLRILTEFDAYEVFLVDEFIHNAIIDVVHGTCNGVGFYDENNKINKQELLKQLMQKMDEVVKKYRRNVRDRRPMKIPTSIQPQTLSSKINNKNQESQPQYLPGNIATKQDCSFGPGESYAKMQDHMVQEDGEISGPLESDVMSKKRSPPIAKLICKQRTNSTEESKPHFNTMTPSYIQPHHNHTVILPKLCSDPISYNGTRPFQESNSVLRPSMYDTRSANEFKKMRGLMRSKLIRRMEKQKSRWKVKKTPCCHGELNTQDNNKHIDSSTTFRNICADLFASSHQDSKKAMVQPSEGNQPPSHPTLVSDLKKERSAQLPSMSMKVKDSTISQPISVENKALNMSQNQNRSNVLLPAIHGRHVLCKPMLPAGSSHHVSDDPTGTANSGSINDEEDEEERDMTTETESDGSDISPSNHTAGDSEKGCDKRDNTAKSNGAVPVSSTVNHHENNPEEDEDTHSHDKRSLIFLPKKPVSLPLNHHENDFQEDEDTQGHYKGRLPFPPKKTVSLTLNHHENDTKKNEETNGYNKRRLLFLPGKAVGVQKGYRPKMLKPGMTRRKRRRIFVVHDYCDHADDPLFLRQLQPEKKRGQCEVEHPFPARLHNMLSASEANGQSDIVSWQPHGRAFRVHKPDKFVREIMPLYFRQTKITSFQRQLNLYNYRRITRLGRDKGAYYHELFLRGRPDLVSAMKRSRLKGTGYKAAANPNDEPDFYDMCPIGVAPDK